MSEDRVGGNRAQNPRLGLPLHQNLFSKHRPCAWRWGWGGWHCCCATALEVVVGRVGSGVGESFPASPPLHLLRALDGTLKACVLISKQSHL